jgi:hypothetical protein
METGWGIIEEIGTLTYEYDLDITISEIPLLVRVLREDGEHSNAEMIERWKERIDTFITQEFCEHPEESQRFFGNTVVCIACKHMEDYE